jgi:hypothetical protein
MDRSDEQAALNDRDSWNIVVIGAGQAGLAVSYYLRRTPWSWIVVDGEIGPGAAWRHGWDSLHLFSPAQWSSLPGWPMPAGADGPPTRDETAHRPVTRCLTTSLPMKRATPYPSSDRYVSRRFGAAMERCWSRAIAASIGRGRSSARPVPGRSRSFRSIPARSCSRASRFIRLTTARRSSSSASACWSSAAGIPARRSWPRSPR